ncbi:MAG: TIGR00730 family Rossman fold protein [Hyphomicrobiaceae bacterium]|nr:TIGR00730 family Rossman fold protein [Hyphomicrobiaceae bacterium]
MKKLLKNICVYCGSGPGNNPAYADAARKLGKAMAEADIGLVYGGGSIGLMGEIARSVLDKGGYVTGIIPEFLSDREIMLTDVQELIVTHSMHERKQVMFERSDAFVALPGGVGTLEELVEQLTWSQLGQHKKPIILADVNNFWSPFLALIDHMRREAFVRSGLEVHLTAVKDPNDIIAVARSLAAKAAKTADGELSPEKF